ncbi:MAG: hypothetical protein MJK18_08035, partial [Bdellovibrionales bacterium]|nr:hypothetical protein [Bdellovibrionales bacterium]
MSSSLILFTLLFHQSAYAALSCQDVFLDPPIQLVHETLVELEATVGRDAPRNLSTRSLNTQYIASRNYAVRALYH